MFMVSTWAYRPVAVSISRQVLYLGTDIYSSWIVQMSTGISPHPSAGAFAQKLSRLPTALGVTTVIGQRREMRAANAKYCVAKKAL